MGIRLVGGPQDGLTWSDDFDGTDFHAYSRTADPVGPYVYRWAGATDPDGTRVYEYDDGAIVRARLEGGPLDGLEIRVRREDREAPVVEPPDASGAHRLRLYTWEGRHDAAGARIYEAPGRGPVSRR